MGELKLRGRTWWVRYYRDGRRFEESAKTKSYEKARTLLKDREGDVAKGVPFSPAMTRLKFDEAIRTSRRSTPSTSGTLSIT